MPGEQDKNSVFDKLRRVFAPFAGQLVIATDEPEHFSLNTLHIMANQQPLFFGAVQVKQRYVSFHPMPVYAFSDLLDDLDERLRKRMHGKSCFNFTAIDETTLHLLHDLTRRGFERYQREGLLGSERKQAS